MNAKHFVCCLGSAAVLLLGMESCTTKEDEIRWPTLALHAPAQALQGLAVTVTLDLTPGTAPLVQAALDFDGNGTMDTLLLNPPAGTWAVEHVFTARGWPMVKGRVIDAEGRSVDATRQVTVTRGAPPALTLLAPASAVDSAVIRFVVTPGDYPLTGFSYEAAGDGCFWSGFDSTAESDGVMIYRATLHEGGPTERITVSARVTDALGQVSAASASVYLVGVVTGLLAWPDDGPAPLTSTLRLIHRPHARFAQARLAWRTDSTWDTTYVPDRDTLYLPVTFDNLGTARIRAEIFDGVTTLYLTDSVRVR